MGRRQEREVIGRRAAAKAHRAEGQITFKLTLEYDGTRFSGWQQQQNAHTVAGELHKAAEDYFEAAVEIQGSGRTDAGVHALRQVAHLRVNSGRSASPFDVLRALNDRLPASVSVLEVELAPNSFHARHDAKSRTYLYQISKRKSAFSKKYVWWIKDTLDVALMSQAARMIAGRHNFICFRAHDSSRPSESTIVVVESAEIDVDDDLILFRIQASHFLWRMVRRLVGALVKLGAGAITLADFQSLLEGKCRSLDVAAWTAPASGLFLESVQY